MTITEAVNQRREGVAAIKAENARHEKEIRNLNTVVSRANEVITAVDCGLDTDKIQLAETVIHVYGEYGPHGEQREMLAKAIEDIAAGCGNIRSVYFATKHYDRWSHQGCTHSYFMGPRHGSIVWSVGLQEAPRQRVLAGGELSPAETEAAIYYLLNLKEIAAVKASAKVLLTA